MSRCGNCGGATYAADICVQCEEDARGAEAMTAPQPAPKPQERVSDEAEMVTRLRVGEGLIMTDERATIADAMEWLREALDAAESRCSALRRVLQAVLLDSMGGTPDLFYPEGGWDEWDEEARALLSDAPSSSADASEEVERTSAPIATPTTCASCGAALLVDADRYCHVVPDSETAARLRQEGADAEREALQACVEITERGWAMRPGKGKEFNRLIEEIARRGRAGAGESGGHEKVSG